MADDRELETFNVGILVYLHGRDEALTVMCGLRAPADHSRYNGDWIVAVAEEFIEDQQRDNAVAWLRFESAGGDVAIVYKNQVQFIRIMKPEVD